MSTPTKDETKPLITVMHGDEYSVMMLFVVTSATAPVTGVFFGGWLVDRVAGGFKGVKERKHAMRLVTLFGVLANMAAIPATFVPAAGMYVQGGRGDERN